MSPEVRNHVIVLAAVVAAVVVAIVIGSSESVGWVAAIVLVAGHLAVGLTAWWGIARARSRRSKASD